MAQILTDPYATLGVPRDATERQVRAAYRRLAMRYHPDRHPDERTSERMRGVNEAWHILSSPVRRRRYDAGTRHWATQDRATQDRATRYTASRYATPAPVDPTQPQEEGPGLAGALGIVAVAWLVFGTISLGFLPAPIIGLALLAVARLVLGGILRR
jgi:curved DNA-binding protein CbpA